MMKKNFYFLLMAALVCFLSLSVTSCKDDDKNNDESGEEFTDGPQAEQNEATTKFWSVVGELVGMDEFTENYKDGPFEPIIGEEDPDNAQARVVYVNDAAAAAEHFANLVDLDASQINEDTPSYPWNDPDVGSLTYTKGDGTTAWATVDVRIKQVPKLEKIIYRAPSQTDSNGKAKEYERCYYRFGDVLARTDKNGKETEYWVCVRPAFDPEGKGDSHWVSVSPVPAKNQYTWTYKNVQKKKNINVTRTYVLPTGLGTSEEHMQNFAEMLFAIFHPKTWYQNVVNYAQGKKNDKLLSLKMFNDFHPSNLMYHNMFFWNNVRGYWSGESFSPYENYTRDTDICKKVFGLNFEAMKELIDTEGIYFLYKGYSWPSGNAPTLYQAYYCNAQGGTLSNMHQTNLSKVKKAVYNKDNPSQDIEFNIATTCTMEHPYIVNEKFFGDTHRRFIIRHATGAELAKPQKFNKDAAISTLKEIYRYYHYERLFSSKPEETPGYEDRVPL
jgi:hypothetical protein